MALSAQWRNATSWASEVAHRTAELAYIWRNDILSYLSPARRSRISRLLGPSNAILITGDRSTAFNADGSRLAMLDPSARERVVSLRVDATDVMRRQLDVPRALAARLDAALTMNLETWTPFCEADVYALARPIPEHGANLNAATMRIEIRCVPRGVIDDRVEALSACGLEPDAIQLGDPDFEILRPTAKLRSLQWRRKALIALGGLALLQGAVLHVFIAGRQLEEIESLEADQERLTQALRQKATAGKQTARAHEALTRIAARFDRDQSVSQALQILAAALPADVIIREIAFNRDRAEGTLTLGGTKDLDIAGLLGRTEFYKAREITSTGTSDPGQRLYSVAFGIARWTSNETRSRR